MTEQHKEEHSIASNKPLEQHTSYALSDEETRQVLTPFAFEIDKSLFGIHLASPWRRGYALLIDLFLIAILSAAPGELLAIVIAITVFKLGSKKRSQISGKKKGSKRRAMLRLLGAFIVFGILVEKLPEIMNGFKDEQVFSSESDSVLGASTKSLSGTNAIAFSLLTAKLMKNISVNQCETVKCWQGDLAPYINKYAKFDLDSEVINDALASIVENTGLNLAEQEELYKSLLVQYSLESKSFIEGKDNSVAPIDVDAVDKIAKAAIITPQNIVGIKSDNIESSDSKTPVYSFIELTKGLINDLGLGFGWAAFYFTVFTAMWQGQTPGKKLFSIKVLQLDGTPLSILDSFGRYGGYGAGIATGLLGFLQIFWDPNRQAIHDKISSTVVIDIKKLR